MDARLRTLTAGLASIAMTESSEPSIAKCILVALGFLTTLAWIWGLFFFPHAWSGVDGKDHLLFLMAASALHFLGGLVLLAASIFRMLRLRFGIAVCVAPLFHFAGATVEEPLCLVPFILPSVAIIVLGFFELRHSPGLRIVEDTEP